MEDGTTDKTEKRTNGLNDLNRPNGQTKKEVK